MSSFVWIQSEHNLIFSKSSKISTKRSTLILKLFQ